MLLRFHHSPLSMVPANQPRLPLHLSLALHRHLKCLPLKAMPTVSFYFFSIMITSILYLQPPATIFYHPSKKTLQVMICLLPSFYHTPIPVKNELPKRIVYGNRILTYMRKTNIIIVQNIVQFKHTKE